MPKSLPLLGGFRFNASRVRRCSNAGFPHAHGLDAARTVPFRFQLPLSVSVSSLLPLSNARWTEAHIDTASPRSGAGLAPPLDDQVYKHPYSNRNLIWRLCFRTKRFLYLLWVFLPSAAIGLVSVLTGSIQWRRRWIEALVRSIEKAGCSIQKFAQWMSMRPDICPPDVARALSKLRTDAPTHELAYTQALLREVFGVDLTELFEEFDPDPVSSGTVAQVYRATLQPQHAFTDSSGNRIVQVAVKVRHPAAVAETFCDLSIIVGFIGVSSLFHLMVLPLDKIEDGEFAQVLQRQVDLTWEAAHLRTFAANFEHEIAAGDVAFPAVHHALVSNEVLVESWCSGRTVDTMFSRVGQFLEVEQPESLSPDEQYVKLRLADILFDVTMKMMIRDNLCHGDLHAGNLLFTCRDSPVTLIDAGLTTSLSHDSWRSFLALLQLMCQGDARQLSTLLQKMNKNPSALSNPEQLSAFEDGVAAVVGKWIRPGWVTHPTTPTGTPVPLGDLLGNLLFTCSAFKLQLPSDVASSITTISMFEGLICQLNPEFDVVANSLPYFRKYPIG